MSKGFQWEKHLEAIELLKKLALTYRDVDIAKIIQKKYPKEKITYYAVQKKRQILGLEKPYDFVPTEAPRSLNEHAKQVLSWLQLESLSVGEISRRLDRSKDTVIKIIDELHASGFDADLEEETRQVTLKKEPTVEFKPIDIKPLYRQYAKIGLLSDTHFGSVCQQPSLLYTAYEVMEEEEVDFAVLAGDLSDGVGLYRGQEQESFVPTKNFLDWFEAYIVRHYPRTNKFKTYITGGNHDYKLLSKYGFNLVRRVCKRRKDLVWRKMYQPFQVKGLNLRLVHPRGGGLYAKCFDEKTEVLTERGFKKFNELDKQDKVATLNPQTHDLEFQRPTESFEYNWEGDLYHFKARSFDLLVTPSHKMYVRRYEHQLWPLKPKEDLPFPRKSHRRVNRKWQLIEANDLLSCGRQEWQMKKDCQWLGEEKEFFEIPYVPMKKFGNRMKHFGKVKMDDFLAFLGWFISEGSCSSNGLKISQLKDNSKRQEIFELCQRLGFSPIINKQGISVPSRELISYLHDNVGTLSREKRIPQEFKRLSKRQLLILLDSLFKGDGWLGPDGKWLGYASYSKTLRDDVQECLIKVGLCGTICGHTVTVIDDQLGPTINSKPKKVFYSGKVYDVTVPNHIILVRRNGRVVWSGNSYKGQRLISAVVSEVIEDIQADKGKFALPDFYCMGHLHFYCSFRESGIWIYTLPAFQSKTRYFQEHGWHPDIGFIILKVYFDSKGNVKNIHEQEEKKYIWNSLVKKNDY